MACVSREYIASKKEKSALEDNEASPLFKALMYSTNSDMKVLMSTSKSKIARLPVLHLLEAMA